VSRHDDKREIAHLQQVNEELTDSLERCRELLTECRSKLAANGNDPLASDDPPAIRLAD
jgi:nitrate/nitrite-specific signal transduction histidine kinase